MNETKEFIIFIIVVVFWSAVCFGGGYILSNSRAIEQLNQANRELTEQQQKYELVISSTTKRLRDIREKLSRTVGDNNKSTKELRDLVEQIQKQKLDV